MNKVKIIVYDPMTHNKIIYEYTTTRVILEKSDKFKEWFKHLDIYRDFIEIGEQGYSGLCNLMLFNKYGDTPYLLTINCAKYVHDLGMLHPPVISNILNYLNGIKEEISETDYRDQKFKECLKYLKL